MKLRINLVQHHHLPLRHLIIISKNQMIHPSGESGSLDLHGSYDVEALYKLAWLNIYNTAHLIINRDDHSLGTVCRNCDNAMLGNRIGEYPDGQ